jgi:hypothetical protein
MSRHATPPEVVAIEMAAKRDMEERGWNRIGVDLNCRPAIGGGTLKGAVARHG